jgi:carbon monoxide dehydrogenase subunit G
VKLSDEIRIEAPVATVFAALNDPDVLMACIPGCEELIKRTETEMDAKAVLKIGPMKARFSGAATVLTYLATAEIGGKMAQLGSRLVQSTASKLAGQFFTKFAAVLEAQYETEP